MSGQQQLEYHLPVLSELCCICADYHAVLGNNGAGGLDASALIFNNAQAAASVNGQTFTVAEIGDVDMILLCNFKYVARIFKFTA